MVVSPISPSDEHLIGALRALRTEHPTLGIVKLHAVLLRNHPEWTISERRFRKVLQQQGLNSLRHAHVQEGQSTADIEGKVFPTSRLIERLDVEQWTKKVEVMWFGNKKGKGLVAKERIEKGATVWKEDPWIIAPEWDIYNAQEASLACAFCTTPLTDSRIVVPCSATSPCSARFCNRLCLAKSAFSHPLLCRAQNPAVVPLLDFAKRAQWLGLHALTHQTAKLLLANEQGKVTRDAQWRIVRGFAEMGMEDRVKENGQTSARKDRTAWKGAHKLYVQAFRTPIDPAHQKKLARLVKQPLRDDIENELFPYDAFLRGLVRMNLNLEAHGGLYILHSHLNHACQPNISVRHFDQRTALARITLVALDDIEPGKELVITYVDPSLGVRERCRQLREWGFGECRCPRCVKEAADFFLEKAKLVSPKVVSDEGAAETSKVDQAELAKELMEGFGF